MVHSFHSILLSTLLVAACQQPEPAAKQTAPAKTDATTPAEPAKTEPAKTDAPKPAEPAPAKTDATKPAEPTTPTDPAVATPTEPAPAVSTGTCSEVQATLSKDADERAKPYGIVEHLQKNFPDLKVSWLMKETPYQSFVVKTAAEKFGRCNETGCYLFAAPTKVIEEAVEKSMKDGKHDPAVIGQALGLPAANFEGPLRMMTLDLDDDAPTACVRLPVDTDPGVWKCQTPEDKDCFKFGGYTSGNVPEVMVIDAPVAKAVVKEIP